ncbi:MAG: hypothetical protein H7A45_21185 [Verrucomicrobiales bacterium]|nr:hypothetical protein [Verrucomicrobiales bacterium]MCP5525697.1 hypothetical protein [Verrucomicrobiales bacterium]
MSLSGSRARLAALTKDLLGRWDVTKTAWQDGRAHDFEERYLTELSASVNRALGQIEQLERVIHQIRHDCE